AVNLRQPFGIANTDSVVRFPYRSDDLKARGPAQRVFRLPGGGYNQHWTRTIVFSPDGKKLYVSVGSRENVGVEAPPRACILEVNPDGSGGHVFASGLRNAV